MDGQDPNQQYDQMDDQQHQAAMQQQLMNQQQMGVDPNMMTEEQQIAM